MVRLRSGLARLRHEMAMRGPWRTALDVLHRLTAYHPEDDRSFDRRHGTDTTGRVEPRTLAIDDAERQGQAIVYLGSPVRVTEWLLDHVDVDVPRTTFVDLGCGKGRVVLVAAARPFRAVRGVELSPELAGMAHRNIERSTGPRACPDVAVVTADVTTYDLPDGDLLLHLYHPFAPAVTELVLERLAAARTAGRRTGRIVVAYLLYSAAVPEVRAAFARADWLRETRYEPSLTGEYDWLLFTT